MPKEKIKRKDYDSATPVGRAMFDDLIKGGVSEIEEEGATPPPPAPKTPLLDYGKKKKRFGEGVSNLFTTNAERAREIR